MITTLKPAARQHLHDAVVAPSEVPLTAGTFREVPDARSHQGLPFAIGALLALVVVLALAVWAYLVLTGGDYSGVIDLTRSVGQ